MKTITQLVKEVQGSMNIEGLKLKKHEIDLLYSCALGKTSSNDIVEELVKKYKQDK